MVVVSPSRVQENVSMKTRGGPPDTAVRSAVRHGVIPQGAPIIRRTGRTARWEPTAIGLIPIFS